LTWKTRLRMRKSRCANLLRTRALLSYSRCPAALCEAPSSGAETTVFCAVCFPLVRTAVWTLQGGKVMGDVVGVLADAAGGGAGTPDGDANARRRMSLMSDVTGAATPQTGSERERKTGIAMSPATSSHTVICCASRCRDPISCLSHLTSLSAARCAGRASLLLDLAAFVEEGEDYRNGLGAIGEEDEFEEEDEFDDSIGGGAVGGGGGGGGDDLDDVDILGVASGETTTI
jgi:hypothetical protein